MSKDSHSGDVPRIPAPPPNPRHTTAASTGRCEETTVAQLDVTLEEVHATFGGSKVNSDINTDQSISVNTENGVWAPTTPAALNNNDSAPVSGPGETIPVYYSKQNGDIAIRQDTLHHQPDGSSVIQTAQYQSPPSRYQTDRPLTPRYQNILKILSIVAAVVFFPTGIPAALHAFRVSEEFQAGIVRGDIDKARKYAKRAEKLIIFSFLLAIVVVVITFALVERSKWTGEDLTTRRLLPT